MVALAANITGLDLNRLAEELGAGLKPPLSVWNSFGIWTKVDASAILELEVFQEMLHEATVRWHTKTNLRERIKAKTLVGMEQFLPDMFDDAMDQARPLHHRVQMWKFLGALAGLDAEAGAAGMAALGGGVSITIDLSSGGPNGSDDSKVVVIRGREDAEDAEISPALPAPTKRAERAAEGGAEEDAEDEADSEEWAVELNELAQAMRGVDADEFDAGEAE